MSIAMSRSTILRSILLAPPTLRSTLLHSRTFQAASLQYSTSVPSVTSASFWKSLIPKPFRKEVRAAPGQMIRPKSKQWNPATFFINIFLLIGSMSIQMIALRNEYATFSRRADARIGLLKEIMERVQNGENVDVEGLLGAGDKDKEKEWEEVLQEIEREDEAWEQSQRKKPKHGRNLENNAEKAPAAAEESKTEVSKTALKTNAPPGFY